MTRDTHTREHRSAVDLTACTCANLRKAARAVTQVYDQALRPTGLKATQFTMLATLSNRGDLPLSRLAEALVMDRTTLTRNLKPLVGKGLVRIDQDQRACPSSSTSRDWTLRQFGSAAPKQFFPDSVRLILRTRRSAS